MIIMFTCCLSVTKLRCGFCHCQEEASASKQQLLICRGEFLQKETELMGKIECLELSNEQLAAALIDSEAEQLKKEVDFYL